MWDVGKKINQTCSFIFLPALYNNVDEVSTPEGIKEKNNLLSTQRSRKQRGHIGSPPFYCSLSKFNRGPDPLIISS